VGIWKLNNSLLETDIFKSAFEQFWLNWKTQKEQFKDQLTWWDIGKDKIREIAMWAGKKLKKSDQHIKDLENKLANTSEQEQNQMPNLDEIRNEINEYYENKTEAARIRAKENWYEKGEKSTKYFFELEKYRAKTKLWNKVKAPNGKYEEGISNILKRQVEFYEHLFKSEGNDDKCGDELLSNISAELNDFQANELELEIQIDELTKAVNSMSKGKSPGEDGITAEFYQKYWYLIGEDFHELVQNIFNVGTLCNSQRKGLITLLYKQGEREAIENWRPITLLNLDYKIIAKTLANRLKEILPGLIHSDQKGFVSGRKIDQGVRMIQDIITLHEEENRGGAIIFLDQKKAFDRVERPWLKQALRKFGFKGNFLKWIGILYENTESSIITNGFRSRHFKIERSVRQGCPIAPYLYILQAEPFAASIRKNENIKGVKLPKLSGQDENMEAKDNAFADDMQLFVSTIPSVKEIFKIMTTYEKASGAAANYEKTQGLLLGTWRYRPPPTDRIKWKENIKALGIWHGYNVNTDRIWNEKIEKIKKNLKMWEMRDLTYEGKILLIKSLGISVVGYEIQMKGMPLKYNKIIKDIFWSFLWKKKTPLVNRESVCLAKSLGGLNMLDLDNYIRIKHIHWIDNIVTSEPQEWNITAKHWLKQWDERANTEYFITTITSLEPFDINSIAEFYREALKSWVSLRQCRKLEKREDILKEDLFANNMMNMNRNSPVFYSWLKSGLRQVRDIWDQTNKIWKTERQILEKLNDKRNWMGQILTIKSIIPAKWKQLLKGEIDDINTGVSTKKYLVISDLGEMTLRSKHVKDPNIPRDKLLKKCTNIELNELLQRNYTRPKCIKHWEGELNQCINWDKTWKTLNENKCERKIKQFQWKCLHNVINTNSRLKKMKKSNGFCRLCNGEQENQQHLFFQCRNTKPVIKKAEKLIREKININIKLSEKNIILGWDENLNSAENKLLSKLIYILKWELWKNRNNKIFNDKIMTPKTIFKIIKRQFDFFRK